VPLAHQAAEDILHSMNENGLDFREWKKATQTS
jgi:hypothetical protein